VRDHSDGIYLAISPWSQNTPEKQMSVLKYSQQGDTLWQKTFPEGWLATDNRGNLYAFGPTRPKRPDLPDNNTKDAFFGKYDANGIQQWQRQLDTPEKDGFVSLDVDAAGNLYLVGYTSGSFAQPHQGGDDIIIAAYDPRGTCLWRDQLGSAGHDRVYALRLGDQNDLYFCGMTTGPLARQNEGEDIFVARYERTGKRLWLKHYGTPAHDGATCLEINEQGHVFICGHTRGDFALKKAQRGYGDAFLARIARNGQIVWKRQFGTRGFDRAYDIAPFQDGSGDVVVVGCQYPHSKCQAFCRRYTPEGKLVWTKTVGKARSEKGTCGRMVTIDSANNCYHGGWTGVNHFAVNNEKGNIFLVRFDDSPPSRGH